MEIKYAEIEIEKLQFGVFRPPSWWNKHPKHKEFQKKIIQSIMKDGLKNRFQRLIRMMTVFLFVRLEINVSKHLKL